MSAWDDGYDPYIAHEKGKQSYRDTYGIPYVDFELGKDGKAQRVMRNDRRVTTTPIDASNNPIKPNAHAESSTKVDGPKKTSAPTPAIPAVDPIHGARNNLLDYVRAQLTGRGLNADSGYGKSIFDSVNTRAQGYMKPEDVNYGIFDEIYNTTQGSAKNKAASEFNSWAYDGFENDVFGSNIDDDILSSILGKQKTDAIGLLDQSKARGQINDAGYANALKDLDTQYASSFSRANTMGDSVLGNYRNAAKSKVAGIRSGLDNFSLSTGFDNASAKGGFDSFVNDKRSSLDADIRAAIGDTKFFDTDALMSKAGATGGAGTGALGGQGSVGTAPSTGLTSPLTLSTPLSTNDTKNKGF